MRLLGIDGGFANFGWCLATYDGQKLAVTDMGVIETKKSARKVLQSVDNVRRAGILYETLDALVSEQDGAVIVDCVCSEAMSFPRHASTAAKLAMAWGVVASICKAARLPLVQVSPQDIKVGVAGHRKASKDDMIKRLTEFYPETVALSEEVTPSRREHCYDALGAIVACLDSEIVKMGIRAEQSQ